MIISGISRMVAKNLNANQNLSASFSKPVLKALTQDTVSFGANDEVPLTKVRSATDPDEFERLITQYAEKKHISLQKVLTQPEGQCSFLHSPNSFRIAKRALEMMKREKVDVPRVLNDENGNYGAEPALNMLCANLDREGDHSKIVSSEFELMAKTPVLFVKEGANVINTEFRHPLANITEQFIKLAEELVYHNPANSQITVEKFGEGYKNVLTAMVEKARKDGCVEALLTQESSDSPRGGIIFMLDCYEGEKEFNPYIKKLKDVLTETAEENGVDLY